MITGINEIIEAYIQQYSDNYPPIVPRLPIKPSTEEDMYYRMTALYQIETERRGCLFVDDEHTRAMIQKVVHWLVHGEKRGLLLIGTLGNGKSTMLRCIHRVMECSGSLGDAQQIFEHFKRNSGEMRYWDEKLLLIDDLGIEPEKCLLYGEEHHPLTRLLLHRYDRNLTTVIATNLDMAEIQSRYGDRVTDRLCEMYDSIVYMYPSYRLNQ